MGRTLHAFKSYKIEGPEYSKEIAYVDDVDFDVTYGGWSTIYKVIKYGDFLLGTKTQIPIYDIYDDAERVQKEGMALVEPDIFIKLCEVVIDGLKKDGNPIINSAPLFSTDTHQSMDEQRDNLFWYADMLLTWSKQGLYFVEDRE